ncbi:response regulator [Ferruginibacter sp. HRS2-29]|uniref:response regulator n=1 Tax=Ferruginibacter sp. HRS2-29 TaxID=2487334 RepID=UPI0020CE1401|nr:response regulator [Ferruginibacter sp. HRS2-29]MCP9752417.1 response regulator [Ferruginibacter sp. HRS2-29]
MAYILALDDNSEILNVFRIILRMNGHELEGVVTKEELLNSLKSRLPDAILMDIQLGDADGRELCLELKNTVAYKHIPVILISASPTKLAGYKKYKAEAALEKPFDLQELTTSIENVLVKNTGQ